MRVNWNLIGNDKIRSVQTDKRLFKHRENIQYTRSKSVILIGRNAMHFRKKKQLEINFTINVT